MPEKDRESIVSKATAMKKAGFHPVMIVVITVLSSPGIWQQFFDDTDEQALEAIQKAYPVLAKEVEHLQAQNQRLYVELQSLRRTMMFLMMGGEMPYGMGMPMGGGSGDVYGALMPPEALFPASADGDGDADEEGAEEPPEGVEPPPPPPPPPAPPVDFDGDWMEDGHPLEGLIQQQEMPVRDKLPKLGELLRQK